MAIAFDSASSSNTGTGTTNTLTWSHTCSGSDRVLMVGVCVTAGATPTSVTYNGVAMALVGSINNGIVTRCSFYRLVGPATGTNDVTVTFGGNNRFATVAASYAGVSQVDPNETAVTDTGNSQDATVNVTTDAGSGQWVVACISKRDSTEPITAGSDTDERAQDASTAATASQNVIAWIGDEIEAGASVTINGTWPATNRNWAMVAVALNPAVAGVTEVQLERLIRGAVRGSR